MRFHTTEKGMNRLYCGAGAVLISMCAPAMAGEHQDKLAECLTQSATQEDKDALVRWIFAAMAAHPLTEDLAEISDDQRDVITRQGGAVFEKLMTDSCGAETIGTIRYEGTDAFGKAFEVLGSSAMEGLMSHPNVERSIAELSSHIDESKLEGLLEKHSR